MGRRRKKCQPPGNVPCRNPGLNQGPLDLQSNALPTELFRLTREMAENNFQFPILDTVWSPRQQITLTHIKTDWLTDWLDWSIDWLIDWLIAIVNNRQTRTHTDTHGLGYVNFFKVLKLWKQKQLQWQQQQQQQGEEEERENKEKTWQRKKKKKKVKKKRKKEMGKL